MAAEALYQRLLALLEDERHAILSGQIADLRRIAAQKERIRAQLARQPALTDAPRLARLRALADHNAALLAAAQRGLIAARDTLERLRSGTAGPALSTYDRHYRRADLAAPAIRRLERRS